MALKVAIQGISGSFHHGAAKKYFDQEIELIECETFKDLARAIDRNNADKAIMAIENSIAGAILPNYALIVQHNLQIIGEVYLPIEHYLMAIPGEEIQDLKKVVSHPMALLQCQEFFEDKEKIKLVESNDTAGSAKWLMERQKTAVAVIAPKDSANEYGLEILAEKIQTIKDNFTRFVVVQKRSADAMVHFDKASLRFTLKHEIGSLYEVLRIFNEFGLNLSKIQSVPIIEKPWEYAFLVDVLIDDWVDYKQSLIEIDQFTHNLKILGEYKKGKK